jgi:hypothetical protein
MTGPATTPEALQYRAGAKKSTVWGTEVALAAGNEIKLFKSPNLPTARKQDYLMLKESGNKFLSRGIASGVSACDFTVPAYMRYDAGPLGEFFAELCGTAGTPATVESGVYLHTFQWADSSLGLFSSYAEEYPGKIYSVPSAKPLKIVFSLDNGILKMDATLRGSSIILSAVNPDLDDLTMINDEDEVRFDQCDEVWLAEYPHGDALAVTEQKTISGMEITLGRGLETPKMTAGNVGLTEAQEENFSDLRLKLDFPYDDAFNRLFFEHFVDGTCYSMIQRFRGLLLGATAYYELTFFWPKLRLAALPDLTKEGLVKVTAEFQALEAAIAPTGFAYKRPYFTLQNARSTDYLA